MARVSVVYDESLKKQVFMVRGDERYARSTSTLLELGQRLEGSTSFSQELIVNVLRDKGDGSIVLYDNDEALNVINDWNSQSGARTILLEDLAYDTDYNFKATYMGNKSCNRSSSKTINVNVENKNLYDVTLSTDIGSQFDPNELGVIANVTLSALMSEYVANQPIEVVYDGTVIETVTTDVNGVAQFTIPDIGDTGLHTLQFNYYGSKNLTNKFFTKNISVGYKIVWTSTPSNPLVVGVEETWTGRVINYLNSGIANERVTCGVGIKDPTRPQQDTTTIYATTNSSGYFSFTNPYVYKAKASVKSGVYATDWVEIPYVSPTSVSVSSSEPVLSKNNTNNILVQTNSTYEGTKVGLTIHTSLYDSNAEIQVDGAVIEQTLYTDSKGLATFEYVGSGQGGNEYPTDFIAKFGNLTSNKELWDFVQYWDTSKQYNEEKLIIGLYLLKLSSVLRLQLSSSGANTFGIFKLPVDNGGYTLEMTGVTSNKAVGLVFLQNNLYDNTIILPEGFNPMAMSTTTLKGATISIIRKKENEDWKVKVNIVNGSQTTHYEYSNQNGYVPTLLFLSITSGQANIDFKTLALWRD